MLEALVLAAGAVAAAVLLVYLFGPWRD